MRSTTRRWWGSGIIPDVEDYAYRAEIPAVFNAALARNPFRTATTITLALPEAADGSGHDPRTRQDVGCVRIVGRANAGFASLAWDGRTDGGRRVGPGIYFYQVEAGTHRARGKMTLLR